MKLALFFITLVFFDSLFAGQPNILWICVEDASPHISCYGEKAISTPSIDELAKEGVKFNKAFVTAPVCSSSRSAMVSGMFQTTSGYLHHRSQRFKSKGSGNKAYYHSYKVPSGLKLVPELFKEHGYYVSNAKKTDYNFEANDTLYDSSKDWSGRKKGQPFFAQIQLAGGKNRSSKEGVDTSKMKHPPYYPNTEVIREDWARYLGSWVLVDHKVKGIISDLKKSGELENTYIFFWTDHGVSHIRGKQFLYEEGIKVPLIIRFPNKQNGNMVREDMVSHIDIPVTSLQLAGIEVPDYMQGQSIFRKDYKEQDSIFTARDRCDETVDIIRSVRTKGYKYIRNFLPHCSHMQRSQYKEGKSIVKEGKMLFAEGKLNAVQEKPFLSIRPTEELYDLRNDPFEINNLALKPNYSSVLSKLRNELKAWMINSKDMGLIPEPILEELGREYGSKYEILRAKENSHLVRDLLQIIESGENGVEKDIEEGLQSSHPAIRYWAAKAVGNQKLIKLQPMIVNLLNDKNGSVRVSAAESLAQLGDRMKASKCLAKEVDHENLLIGMYAIRAIEAVGEKSKVHTQDAILKALKSKYEFTMRVSKRLVKEWGL